MLTQKFLLGFSRKVIKDLPEYSNGVVLNVVAIPVLHILRYEEGMVGKGRRKDLIT